MVVKQLFQIISDIIIMSEINYDNFVGVFCISLLLEN